MPYKVSWYDPASVVFAQFEGHIHLTETVDANRQEFQFLDQAKTKAFLIADVRRIERQDGSLTQISDVLSILKHHKLNQIIVIRSRNPFISFLSNTIIQIFHVRAYQCDNLGDATLFIQEQLRQDSTFGDALAAWLDNELL